MKKVDQIRALLRANPKGLMLADIAERTGIKNPGSIMAHMLKTGEVSVDGERGSKHYTIDSNFLPAGKSKIDKALPIKRKGKKKKTSKKPRGGAMPKRKIKTLKQIADKLAAAPKLPLSKLLLDNLIVSGRDLAKAVQSQVDGVEDNPALQQAITQHERAAVLVEAA